MMDDPAPDDVTEKMRKYFEEHNQMRLKVVAANPHGWAVRLIDMDSGKMMPIRNLTITWPNGAGEFATVKAEFILFAADINLAEGIEDLNERKDNA